jgi:flagellar basal body-associated protein FliL
VIVVVGVLSVALALVLGVAAFWLARTLRRKRDEHKAAKAQRLKQTTAVTNTIRFCRKCGEKLIDNSRFCSRCGTKIVEENNGAEYEEDDVWGTEIEKGNSVKKIILIVSLAFILLAGVVCAALFFMRPKVIPQDIHTINGCPEFYHVEFGMTVDQASKVIQMKSMDRFYYECWF